MISLEILKLKDRNGKEERSPLSIIDNINIRYKNINMYNVI